MNDIYDTGTPKYKSPHSIYDGLCALVGSEEIHLLAEMFPDVSWERQGFYYQDNGDRLKDKFEELTDYGNKMWVMEIAVWQLDRDEVHSLIFEALANSDFAKRIGLKKLFVEHMLGGNDTNYKKIIAEYEEEIREADFFNVHEMAKAFARVMKSYGRSFVYESPYPLYNNFLWRFCEKAERLDVRAEATLVAECRAMLTSYDDFIFGLKVNQALHQGLEQAHGSRMASLQSKYDKGVQRLLMLAEKHGLLATIKADIDLLESQNSLTTQEDEPEIYLPLLTNIQMLKNNGS